MIPVIKKWCKRTNIPSSKFLIPLSFAAIMFPIALASARLLAIDPRPLLIALAIAASASFATPIGYQTNLMVYGPGGYRFADFLKIGLVMKVVVGFAVSFLLYILFF